MPFIGRFLINKMRDERAFGIVEALIAMTIMALVLIALLGLLTASVKAVSSSKLSTTATQIANGCLEDIRSKDYDSVGISGRDYGGTIPAQETRVDSGVTYTINYDVVWVDDTVDGTGTADADDGGKDYKQVIVTVNWTSNGAPQTLSVSTYIKSKPKQIDPPTVNFVLGTYGDLDLNETPPDGTVFGTDNSPYKTWFDNGTIPLKAIATDPNSDLVTMRFIIGLQTPSGGYYNINPTNQYDNLPVCYWNPNTIDSSTSAYLWGEGTHEVTVEIWDAHGNRDAKNIFWTIDRYAPPAPTSLVAQAIGNSTISLSWQPVYDGTDKVMHYQIYRKGPGLGGNFNLLKDSIFTSTSFSDSGLPDWSTYQYYLVALSPGGRLSSAGNTVTATTMFGITVTVSNNKKTATVQWSSPPVGTNVDRFDVVRNGIVQASLSGSITQYSDSLPSGHGTYQYQVRAYYGGNLVNQSTTVSVTI